MLHFGLFGTVLSCDEFREIENIFWLTMVTRCTRRCIRSDGVFPLICGLSRLWNRTVRANPIVVILTAQAIIPARLGLVKSTIGYFINYFSLLRISRILAYNLLYLFPIRYWKPRIASFPLVKGPVDLVVGMGTIGGEGSGLLACYY